MTIMLLLLAALQDPEPRHPWTRSKPGSWIRVKGEESEWTETLVRASDQEYTIRRGEEEETVSIGGFTGYAWEKAGRETLKIGGKEYACDVWKGAWIGGRQEEVRVWIAGALTLKREINGEVTRTVVALAEDEFTVGKRKVKGLKIEWKIEGLEPGTLEEWRSDEVPGGWAKSIETRARQGVPSTITIEVVEFEAKP